jgi:hypothetical protein
MGQIFAFFLCLEKSPLRDKSYSLLSFLKREFTGKTSLLVF